MFETQTTLEEALILVVDDEPLNLTIIESLLRKSGLRNVVCLTDGIAALAFLEDRTPACILLDVMMPGVNGLEVCRRLRADPRFARVPVIVQTAMSSREDRRAAFAAGASDVVAKPYDPAELEARVRVHLTNALLSDTLYAYRAAMEAELGEARALSETILPQPEALADIAAAGVAFSHSYYPCSAIGGDYWNVWNVGGNRVAFMVGDVSGHGASAALRMFALHTLVTPFPPYGTDPRAMAEHLDRRLHTYGHRRGQYVAGLYGVLDMSRRRLRYVPAGLRDGFIRHRDGRLDRMSLSGLPFGMSGTAERTVGEIDLDDGDTLIFYSDALVECDPSNGTVPASEEDLAVWLAAALETIPQSQAKTFDGLAPWLGDRFMSAFGRRVTDDLLIVTASLAMTDAR